MQPNKIIGSLKILVLVLAILFFPIMSLLINPVFNGAYSLLIVALFIFFVEKTNINIKLLSIISGFCLMMQPYPNWIWINNYGQIRIQLIPGFLSWSFLLQALAMSFFYVILFYFLGVAIRNKQQKIPGVN